MSEETDNSDSFCSQHTKIDIKLWLARLYFYYFKISKDGTGFLLLLPLGATFGTCEDTTARYFIVTRDYFW